MHLQIQENKWRHQHLLSSHVTTSMMDSRVITWKCCIFNMFCASRENRLRHTKKNGKPAIMHANSIICVVCSTRCHPKLVKSHVIITSNLSLRPCAPLEKLRARRILPRPLFSLLSSYGDPTSPYADPTRPWADPSRPCADPGRPCADPGRPCADLQSILDFSCFNLLSKCILKVHMFALERQWLKHYPECLYSRGARSKNLSTTVGKQVKPVSVKESSGAIT